MKSGLIEGCRSLSHAGMNRIRSQGLLSARPEADTPSDMVELYAGRRQLPSRERTKGPLARRASEGDSLARASG
jgi:hypothetical protein